MRQNPVLMGVGWSGPQGITDDTTRVPLLRTGVTVKVIQIGGGAGEKARWVQGLPCRSTGAIVMRCG